MRGVVSGLKGQLADAQAVADAKHDACDADIRELAGGMTQAHADMAKFEGLSAFDAATLESRKAELADKIR